MLWDTAGQEEFDALTKAYYRGAQGCVLAFSTTDRDSFDAVERWKKKVEYECGDIPMALVQNKIDLVDQAKVSSESVEKLTKKLNIPLFLTSARKNVNIDQGLLNSFFFHFIVPATKSLGIILLIEKEACPDILHFCHFLDPNLT
jgi:Ras-related protein Rab-23